MTEIVKHEQQNSGVSVFNDVEKFVHAQKIATMLSQSDIVPDRYRGKAANCIVAVELAFRMNESPLMVMQNLDIIKGQPGFNSKFVIGKLNTCGKFSSLRFRYSGDGDAKSCVAYCKDAFTGEDLEGPPVSIAMAKAEGWYGKPGSKWPTMPDTMLMYRSGKFFGNMYAPELVMGMMTTEEILDISERVAAGSVQEGSLTANGALGDLKAKVDKKKAGKNIQVEAEEVHFTPAEEVADPTLRPNTDDELM